MNRLSPVINSGGDSSHSGKRPSPPYPPTYDASGESAHHLSSSKISPPDMESGRIKKSGITDFAFSDKTIRMGFVRKVYGILTCQIGITVAIVALFTFHEDTRLFVDDHEELIWIAAVLLLSTLIVLTCCGELRRKSPLNYICLGFFTLIEGFVLGCSTITYKREEIFYAAAITFLVVLSLTVFAFQTKIDFTATGGILFVTVVILVVLGIACMFFPSKTMTLIYSSLGALIFSVYVVYDTQIMIGENKYSISPEEYVFAALNVYIDITNLFLMILRILGASRD